MATEKGRRGNECRRLPVFFPSDHINKTGNDRTTNKRGFPLSLPLPAKKKKEKQVKQKKERKRATLISNPSGAGADAGKRRGGGKLKFLARGDVHRFKKHSSVNEGENGAQTHTQRQRKHCTVGREWDPCARFVSRFISFFFCGEVGEPEDKRYVGCREVWWW